MAVTTIYTNKENKFSNILIYIFGIIGVGLVVFFGGQVIENLDNLKGKAGVSVEVTDKSAEILVDNQTVGTGSYSSKDLKPGTKTITIKNSTRQYQTSLNFVAAENGTIPVVGIVKDLGVSDLFSNGQEFWFEKDNSGNVLRIITAPDGASVSIDGSEIGKTPFSSSSIAAGTYDLKISASGYETQTARILVQKGYTLNGNVRLFPLPIPQNPKLLPDSTNLYDLSLDNTEAVADTQSWVKAVVYWNTTRGITVPGVADNKSKAFDFFLDYKGNIYDADGNLISSTSDFSKLNGAKRGGYLGRISDGLGLTKEAKTSLASLSGQVVAGGLVKIKTTPTGWLRVRDSGSLNGAEVAKVNTGTEYPFLEEKSGWIKIRVSETISGWVSKDYVTVTP